MSLLYVFQKSGICGLAGVAKASAALVLGANKDVDTLTLHHDGLRIRDHGVTTGNGVAVTTTAAELNINADMAASVSMATPVAGTHTATVALTFKDAAGVAMTRAVEFKAWLTKSITAPVITTNAPSAGLTMTVGGVISIDTTNTGTVAISGVTTAVGLATIVNTDNANAADNYLAVLNPATGRITYSAVLTYT